MAFQRFLDAQFGGMEQMRDPSLSLMEKVRRRGAARGPLIDDDTLNYWGPKTVMAMMVTATPLVAMVIMPDMYATGWFLRLMQFIGIYSVLQMAVYSYYTRHTDSSVNPDASSLTSVSVHAHTGTSETYVTQKQQDFLNMADLYTSYQTLNSDNHQTETRQREPGAEDAGFTPEFKQRPRRKGFHSGLSYGIKVSRIDESKEGSPREVVTYPYWSRTPCDVCRIMKPQRAYHCPLCKTCVLKRDHHCYLTGACIAVNNQRYFVAFLFWCAFSTTFGNTHLYSHAYYFSWEELSIIDFAFPIPVIRWLLGYIEFRHAYFCVVTISLTAFCLVSWIMFYQIMFSTLVGTTSFENQHRIKVRDSRSVSERVHQVMGARWLRGLLLPFRWGPPVGEDAVRWPSICPE